MTRAVALLRRRLTGQDTEEGSAVIEFVVVGVLLTMPVFYLMIALARLQAGSYAVTAAAREAGRTFVTAPSTGSAASRAHVAARMAFEDQGFGEQGGVRITCGQSPCLQRGGQVEAVADLAVQLPLVPDFLADVVPTSVHLSSRHVATVDRYGSQ